MALRLEAPVRGLPGIGPAAEKDLKNLGILSIGDLLWHLPFRYDDFSVSKPIGSLRHDDTVTVEGTVQSIKTRPSQKNRRLTLTEAVIEDESGSIRATWFNQAYLEKVLAPGTRIAVAGRVDGTFGRGLGFMNPVQEPAGKRVHTGRLVPVYGLSGSLTQRRLRASIASALPAARAVPEWLPEEVVASEHLLPLGEALHAIHEPHSHAELDAAVRRVKFDELFLHQLQFAQVRRSREKRAGHAIPIDEAFLKTFVSRLPFTLTNGQRAAAWEIIQDCAKPSPMNRLLQGDVGSGKTVVAALAIAHTLAQGGRAAYLAPTELLAAQQHATLLRFLPDEPVGLLTGSQCRLGEEEVSRTAFKEAIAEGKVRCFVGTHALLQDSLVLPTLDLIVIDEQHRFGVEQRHALLERAGEYAPHLLSMTATPIPRSLALTVYGDLDVSIIRHRPSGRKPIATHLAFERDRSRVWSAVVEELRAGRRAYVVCPLIDPSDRTGQQAVTDVAASLARKELRGWQVEMLHGKMKPDEKTRALERFRTGKVQVLAATTVVEVGVDVPEATAMVILGAERFGLAQLHQLRGRVGRSELASSCFLLPDAPTKQGLERLKALVDSQDGFALAEKDLALRGAGNVFGSAQSGFPDFKLATMADVDLMKKTRDLAAHLLGEDPELKNHPLTAEKVRGAFERVHLE